MPRRAGYFWDKREQCYRSGVGKRTKYFRGIARDDHEGIAKAWAAHLEEVYSAARAAEPDALDVCLAFVKAARGVELRTRQSHKERLLKFCGFPGPTSPDMIGARRAVDLKAKDLRDALLTWKEEGYSDNYRAGICRSVKAAFAWAASEEGERLIPANPFAEVKVPAVGRSPVRYAERSEVAAFLRFAWRRASAAPGIYRRFGRKLVLMLRIAAGAGVRPGELCSAFWVDFDPAKRLITLPPQRHKTGSKTKKPRPIRLEPIHARALKREQAKPDAHPVVIFTHKRGKGGVARGGSADVGEPWGKVFTRPDGKTGFRSNSTALSRAIREIRAEAVAEAKRRKAARKRTWGLELIQDEGDNRFVAYRLRHTYISDGLMGGVATASIAEVTGTSDRMIHQVYGHLTEDHLQETAEAIRAARRKR